MLGEMDLPGCSGVDLYPAERRTEIDSWNALIYPAVNNGVYRSGFATTQARITAQKIPVLPCRLDPLGVRRPRCTRKERNISCCLLPRRPPTTRSRRSCGRRWMQSRERSPPRGSSRGTDLQRRT